MITKPDSDEALMDAALAELESLPITIGERTAIAIAAVAVADSRPASQVVSEIIERWGAQACVAHETACAIMAESQSKPRRDKAESRREARKAMTPSLRLAVLQRDGHRCISCGANASDAKLHVDHVVSVANGGKTEIGNLQTLCEPCNLAKAAKVVNFPADEGMSRSRK